MVICFSVKEARDHLLKEGFVYTFRWKERKNIGKNWANKGRTTSKIADVYIDEPRLIETPSDLDIYVSGSGFKTRKEWLDVIMSMNKQFNQMHGYLYKVSIISQQLRTVSDTRPSRADEPREAKSETPIPASSGREKGEKEK